MITQDQYFNYLPRNNNCGAREGYGSGVVSCDIGVCARILESTIDIDLDRRHCVHWQCCHIQQQRCVNCVDKTKLLIDLALDRGCLPSNFSLVDCAVSILSHKAYADVFCVTYIVLDIEKSVCIKIVVEYNIADVVDAEIS